MTVAFVPYSGKYTLKLSAEELKTIYTSLEDSRRLLALETKENTPEVFKRASEVWQQNRQDMIASLWDSYEHARGAKQEIEQQEGSDNE